MLMETINEVEVLIIHYSGATFFKKRFIYYFVSVCFFSLNVCMLTMCVSSVHGGHKKVLGPL